MRRSPARRWRLRHEDRAHGRRGAGAARRRGRSRADDGCAARRPSLVDTGRACGERARRRVALRQRRAVRRAVRPRRLSARRGRRRRARRGNRRRRALRAERRGDVSPGLRHVGRRRRRRLRGRGAAGTLPRRRHRVPEALHDHTTAARVLRPEGRAAGRGRPTARARPEPRAGDPHAADGARRRRARTLLAQRAPLGRGARPRDSATAGPRPRRRRLPQRWRRGRRRTRGTERTHAGVRRRAARRRRDPPRCSRTGRRHATHRQRPSGRGAQMTEKPQRYASWTAGKLPLPELLELKRRGEKIVMVTAYDAPSGRLAEAAGVDLILVGDSSGMVVHGRESTVAVSLDEIVFMTQWVARGAKRPIVIADMPFGSYEASNEQAVAHAVRLVKEGGADAVKLERGGTSIERARAIVDAGIAVMGHIGLTPQTATVLGGFKAQGRTADRAKQLVDDALALQEAGCFSVVLEAVPAPVARAVSKALAIPTIGIGAGGDTDGQVLVWHDMLGYYEGHAPRFVKRYADLGDVITEALSRYAEEVRSGAFPEQQHTYSMPDEELVAFEQTKA